MRFVIKSVLSLGLVASLAFGAEVLAIVDGVEITTEVAPEDFSTLEKKDQKEIVKRLIQKRLASDYALSLELAESKEFKELLEHVMQMGMDKEEVESFSLVEILKNDAAMKGYTKEQLYSKKGLLAFDFLLNTKAKEFEADEESLRKYYESKKFIYDTPAMIELLTIVVSSEDLAQKIIDEVLGAKDRFEMFSSLAKEHSLAPSKNSHGYFGKLQIDELNEALKAPLENLKRNELTEKPIKTEFGYEIFYVLNDIPEFDSTFEQVRSKVKEAYVKEEIRNWAIAKIEELEQKAKIEYKIF
ncbi:MAG: hypothetical protein GX170_06440 [Campylobacteraceae bacterium]|jgi:foldase protein PrsA|nr:hypothetical protein [Campylobacteraceae bacterium]